MNELIPLVVVRQGEAPPAGPAGCAQGASPMLMMVVVFAIFYFLVIRPQQKQLREHRAKLQRLKKGDEVVTNGGMIGTITHLDEQILTLQVDDKVRVRVLRSQIASLLKEGAEPAATSNVSLEKGKQTP